MKSDRHKRPPPPLDEAGLERLALAYVGRYATTRARLAAYLNRKLRERGGDAIGPCRVEALVEKMSGLHYVDDAGFASARAAALQRRGFGARRIQQALRSAGLDEADAAVAREGIADGAFAAAVRFASRKRLGPYAVAPVGPRERAKAFAAMMRAGHPPDIARRVLALSLDQVPLCDTDEYC